MKNYQNTYNNITCMMNAGVIDNSLFNLSQKSQVKPASVQNRILRRIVEKRQAQANHRMSKVMTPNESELINWQNDLEDPQNDLIFASQINLMYNPKN